MSTKTIVAVTVAVAVVSVVAYKVNKFRNNVINAFMAFEAEEEQLAKAAVKEEAAKEEVTA